MPSESADHTTKVVLILGVVAVVLIVALAGGGIFHFTNRAAAEAENSRLATEAAAAADVFLTDLASGQVERAYGNTTRDYQARRKVDDLRTYVDQHALLKQHANSRPPMMPLPAVVNDRVTVRLMVDGNPRQVVTVDMVKEDGQWKVDEVLAATERGSPPAAR